MSEFKDTLLIKTLCDLIKCRSITPSDDGAIVYIDNFLQKLGFSCDVQEFSSKKDNNGKEELEKVLNLYAVKTFNQGLNLCFAGHVDVVHPGKEYKWTYPPFEPTIENGLIYGRGTSDMKGSIAAFLTALHELVVKDCYEPKGSISFLITGDEEGSGENGTKKMLQYLKAKNISIDDCIVGEPTNPDFVGQMVKNGRRGSATFFLEIEGNQGHIAYKQNFANPIDAMSQIICKLKSHVFDEGNDFFEPTNLEFFKVSSDSGSTNVVPQSAHCGFNIRFSSEHKSADVIDAVNLIVKNSIEGLTQIYTYTLTHKVSGESFLTSPDTHLAKSIVDAVFNVCGQKPVLSTSGGTSDARFIKNYARVIEFGSVNKTAHQIDENEDIEGLVKLKNIYKTFIVKYFS